MADDGGNTEKETDKKIVHVYPLVKVNKIKNYLKNCHIKINIYFFFWECLHLLKAFGYE